MTKIQQRIRSRYGPNVRTAEINGSLIVHLDNPTDKEMNSRHAEVLNGLILDADCPLCKEMATKTMEAVVFDGDSILCVSEDGVMLT